MTGTGLTLENVGVSYGKTPVLADFHATVRTGSFIAVVGDSGSGKSTLLLVMAGLIEPTCGAVRYDGRPISEARAGFVFQDHALFPWMSVRANVLFGQRIRARTDRESVAERILRRVDLEGTGHQYPHQLSGGMQQRAAVARCLANEPKLILLDEPFGALDTRNRQSMQDLILQIWTEDRPTIVMVTHDIDEAILLADEVWAFPRRPVRQFARFPITFTRPRDRSALARDVEASELRHQILMATCIEG